MRKNAEILFGLSIRYFMSYAVNMNKNAIFGLEDLSYTYFQKLEKLLMTKISIKSTASYPILTQVRILKYEIISDAFKSVCNISNPIQKMEKKQ